MLMKNDEIQTGLKPSQQTSKNMRASLTITPPVRVSLLACL